jgi:hypothetical protein
VSNRANTGTKGVLLVVSTYGATMAVTACIVVVAVIGLMETTNCNDMGRALVMLWKTIAGVFLASVVVVGVVAWRIIPGVAGRWVTVGAYGVAMLASYFVVAFVLMVAFNC